VRLDRVFGLNSVRNVTATSALHPVTPGGVGLLTAYPLADSLL
jgi:hypothetical protein